MNRRVFLKAFPALMGAFALDPEELLWKPIKTIFIPPAASIGIDWADIDADVCRYTSPKLVDQLFMTSPLMEYFKSNKMVEFEGGRSIGQAVTF
jgi:hypothetical protein